MRAAGRTIVALVLLSTAAADAQTVAPAFPRAQALLDRTKPGEEHDVSCGSLDTDVARELLELGQKLRPNAIERATTAFRLVERAGRCSESAPLLGAALNELSYALFARGSIDAARATAEESVRIHERLNDASGLGLAWLNVGQVDWWIENMPLALEEYQRSLELLTAAGNRQGQSRVLSAIAFVHRFFGDYEKTLEYLHRSLQMGEESGDRRRVSLVTANIANVHYNRGEYATALTYARRALDVARDIHDQEALGKALDSLGDIYRVLGTYDLALQSFLEALRVRTAIGCNPCVMETTQNLGVLYFSQGDYALAIDAYKRALQLNRQWNLRDNALVAEALRNIGAAAWQLGQHDRAIANFQESLSVARRDRMRAREGELLNDLGQMALAEGRLADSARLLEQSLAIRKEVGAQAGITETMTALASSRLASHQHEAALRLARQAIENAATHDQPELQWQAQTVAAMACARLGRQSEAKALLHEAIASIERLSARAAASDSLRPRFFESKLSPYHELIARLIAEHSFDEALAIAERSKARVLTRLVRGTRDDQTGMLAPDEQQEQSRLRNAVLALDRQIEREQDRKSPDQTRLSALESSRRLAREQVSAFEAAIAVRHPELATVRGEVAPLKSDDIAGVLADRATAIVEYVVADHQVFAYVVTSGAHAAVDARAIDVDAAELARRVDRFHHEIASRDYAFADDARALYQILLAPLVGRLEGVSQLIVVPDGPLWTVPFQALLGPRGFLVESTAVSYAPSIATLREIRRLAKPAGRRTLLAMAKTEFGSPTLEPLPDAEAQVRQIRDLYGPDRSTVYVGADATEGRFKSSAPRYSVLHLATHGVLDEASPLYSHLVLSASHDNPDDDGRLEAWEIMRLKLTADLVVLAACDTGRGRIAPGEGVVGTMWALFAAGARSMVVSQFAVESKTATTLLVGFHRRVAAEQGTKAAQLRSAALDLLRNPRFAHPYYWAGFILVGDAN